MKVTLSITHDCNLRCDYCYAGEKHNSAMELTTAKKIVDFAFLITPENEPIDFGFFGGEPLLQYQLIEKIITYINDKNSSHPRTFHMTTNGTLLNDEIIEFLRKYEIKLNVSIDGPEHIHDKYRKDKHNQGTLKKVLKNIKQLSKELHIQVNAVYTPDTVTQLQDIVQFLIQNNLYNIHLNPDITASWEEKDLIAISKSYKEVADIYIDIFTNNKKVAINLLDNKLILFFKGGYDASDRCGMGKTEFGFAPSGNLYPCERLIGDDTDKKMIIGNIHNGINLLQRCTLGKSFENANDECKECPVQDYCMNWCGCTNYRMTGYPDKMGAMMCHSERHAIDCAKYVFQTLQENPAFVEHMVNYMHP